MARRKVLFPNLLRFIKRTKERHRKMKIIHFTTHMMGKLFLGIGIGTYFFDRLQPYVIVLIVVGLLLHIPFWHHLYVSK